MIELFIVLLYILFVLAAIVLVVVILLQEGKGGGLTGALGTEGQQTFGVGTKGVNQFTGWTCAVFLLCALGIHMINRAAVRQSVVGEESVLPLNDPAAGQTPAANDGGQTPPANDGGEKPK